MWLIHEWDKRFNKIIYNLRLSTKDLSIIFETIGPLLFKFMIVLKILASLNCQFWSHKQDI